MENDFLKFDPEKLTITVSLEGRGDLVIDKKNVEISYFSGGPGGQNVNRNLKGVRLIYHIPDTHRMNAVRTREIVTRVIGRRSLHHNLITAFEQLSHKLRQYFYVPPRRKKTKVPKKSKEKRLKTKKMQSLKKQSRGKVNL